MKPIEIKPLRVTIVRSKHTTDHVCISFEGTSPWLSEIFQTYSPTFTVEIAAGYAEEWLKDNFDLAPEDYEIWEQN